VAYGGLCRPPRARHACYYFSPLAYPRTCLPSCDPVLANPTQWRYSTTSFHCAALPCSPSPLCHPPSTLHSLRWIRYGFRGHSGTTSEDNGVPRLLSFSALANNSIMNGSFNFPSPNISFKCLYALSKGTTPSLHMRASGFANSPSAVTASP
jgi:hypothetical protein